MRRRRSRRDGARRGLHASPGRAGAIDGRDLHRRARHRAGQAEIPQGRTRPRGDRRHARAEAGARSAEYFQSGKDLAGGLGAYKTPRPQTVRRPTMLADVFKGTAMRWFNKGTRKEVWEENIQWPIGDIEA